MKFPIVVAVAALSLCTASAAERPKVILHGHDTIALSPKVILQNADLLDELPIDGVFIRMLASSKGKKFCFLSIMRDPAWEFEAFSNTVAACREIVKHRSLRHSFAHAWMLDWEWRRKDRTDWRDDVTWERCAHNFGVLARIVRESGLEGVMFDIEDYGGTRQFFLQDEDGDYDEVCKIARRRGREVFGRMFKEKPDLRVMFVWFMTWWEHHKADDPVLAARKKKDLWPSFMNGLLDVMPEDARVIDGNESSYYYRGAESDDYFRAVSDIRNLVLPLVAPENRVAYRGKLLVGEAQFVDAYASRDPNYEYYIPPKRGGTKLDRFYENFRQVLQASEGYVWLYGERHPYVHWRGTDDKRCTGSTWEEELPGLYGVMWALRDPGRYGAKCYLKWAGEGRVPENRIRIGACALGAQDVGRGFLANKLASGFSTWKRNKTVGVFGTDTSLGRGDTFSLCLDAVERGCVFCGVDAKQFEHYVVRVCAKGESPEACIGFNSGGSQMSAAFDVKVKFSKPLPDGWREGYAYVILPEGADRLCVYMQGAKDEKIWYDDIGVFPAK